MNFSRIEQKSGKIPQRAMLEKRKNSQAFHTHSRPLTRLASGMSEVRKSGGGGGCNVVIPPLVEIGLTDLTKTATPPLVPSGSDILDHRSEVDWTGLDWTYMVALHYLEMKLTPSS